MDTWTVISAVNLRLGSESNLYNQRGEQSGNNRYAYSHWAIWAMELFV